MATATKKGKGRTSVWAQWDSYPFQSCVIFGEQVGYEKGKKRPVFWLVGASYQQRGLGTPLLSMSRKRTPKYSGFVIDVDATIKLISKYSLIRSIV